MKKKVLKENSLSPEDIIAIKELIRKEIAKIFFILYARKAMWGAD
jgi:hypothetical protein